MEHKLHFLLYNHWLIGDSPMDYLLTNVYELYNKYYKLPENDDIFSGRIPMIERCVNGEDILILALEKQKIVGFCLLYQNDRDTFVNEGTSVDIAYRRKGIATQMLTIAHQFANKNKCFIISSCYSPDGISYLKKIDEKLISSYSNDTK